MRDVEDNIIRFPGNSREAKVLSIHKAIVIEMERHKRKLLQLQAELNRVKLKLVKNESTGPQHK